MKRIAPLLVILLSGCPNDPPVEPPDDWQVVVEDLDGAILSFWGESTSEIFAVGGPVTRPGQAFILRYDGTQWEHMPLDAPTLWWVQGFGSDDVWAVGEQGLIVHFDGTEWTVVVDGTFDYTLWGVWGASPDNIWTVGGTVTGGVPSIIRHWDGSMWSDVPDVGLDGELLFKVWGLAENDVWVVGTGGATIHYDGSEWTRLPPVTEARLLTVRGRATDDIYAVGGVLGPVVLHYDGSVWSELPVDALGGLMGVWTAPGQPTVISGHNGVVLIEQDAGEFYQPETGTFMDLHGAWGDGEGNYLAGGGILYPSPTPAGAITGLGEVQGGDIGTFMP